MKHLQLFGFNLKHPVLDFAFERGERQRISESCLTRKALVAAFLLVIGLSGGAAAQDADAIQAVIADQLADFVARDVDGAWEHASPFIQGMFGNPQNFGTMVERGYPMVWDNSDLRFGELREVAGNLWQRVTVRDPAGNLHSLDYQMIETPDGWQINAVQLLPPVDTGV